MTHSGRVSTGISAEPELVEIGYFIALTMGQQRWLRTLDIEHHQILPGTAGSMAPGFESAEALQKSKAAEDYWINKDVTLSRDTTANKQAAE